MAVYLSMPLILYLLGLKLYPSRLKINYSTQVWYMYVPYAALVNQF